MNQQDLPPKPSSPPRTGSLPNIPTGTPAPAPESVTWSQPRREPGPEEHANRRPTLWKALFVVVILSVVVQGSLVPAVARALNVPMRRTT